MPYPLDHKARTRARIIEHAGRLFREAGYRATSVDRVMAAAGLTHGGFYAHFRDKTDLFSDVIRHAFAQARENLLQKDLEGLTGPAWLGRAARRYLSDRHRAAPAEGCAIPSLATEVAREGAALRTAFARALDETLAAMTVRLGGDRAAAIRALATWAGALTMARAVDAPLADEILAACRPDSTA